MADLYGRRVIFILCMWIQTAAYVLIFYTQSLELTVLYFAIIGTCQPGRLIVSTMIMCEYSMEKKMALINSMIHTADTSGAIIFIFLVSYFRDIIPFFRVLLIYCCVVNILCLLVPESAKYHLANHRYQEARDSLKLIAKINRVKVTKQEIDSIVFDVEVKNLGKMEVGSRQQSDAVVSHSRSNEHRDSAACIRLEGKLREVV